MARIDELERTYWAAWRNSQKPRATTSQERNTGEPDTEMRVVDGKQVTVEVPGKIRLKASLRTEERDGNPTFLAGVGWCIQQRCKLLGLDVPQNHEIGGPVGEPIKIIEVRMPSQPIGQREMTAAAASGQIGAITASAA